MLKNRTLLDHVNAVAFQRTGLVTITHTTDLGASDGSECCSRSHHFCFSVEK